MASIMTGFIGEQENETTFDQAAVYYEQNCIGISRQVKRHTKESH